MNKLVAKYTVKMVAKNSQSEILQNHFFNQDFYVTHKTCVRPWSADPLVVERSETSLSTQSALCVFVCVCVFHATGRNFEPTDLKF